MIPERAMAVARGHGQVGEVDNYLQDYLPDLAFDLVCASVDLP